jgi:uncharacterized membrane protein
VIPALVAAALLAAAPEAQSAAPAPAAAQAKPADAKAREAKGDALRLELESGKLPEDPARDVVLGKCVICHSE